MLEVVFCDSEKASVKMAKSFQDVVDIGFALDVGDISGTCDGAQRQQVFATMWGRFGFTIKEREQFFQDQRREVDKLLSAAENGTAIRIWVSDAPYSVCGFYFVCHMLRKLDCAISYVPLPRYKQTAENKIVSYRSWGEVEPDDLPQFLPLETSLSPLEKRVHSKEWCSLIDENAPLRAVVNGRLLSVPANFYDHLILKQIPDGEFLMGALVGNVLGRYQLGISDSWIALRIDKMLVDGKLVVVRDEDKCHPYGKILKKPLTTVV